MLQLSKEVQSPKDDLSRELKAVKKKSKQKIEESEKQEEEEVADDGTVPMPIDSEDIVDAGPAESTVTFEDEEPSRIKKLKKKKEGIQGLTNILTSVLFICLWMWARILKFTDIHI